MMPTLTEAVFMVSGTIKHTRLDRQSIPKTIERVLALILLELNVQYKIVMKMCNNQHVIHTTCWDVLIDKVEESFSFEDQAEANSGVRESIDKIPRIKRNCRKLVKLFVRRERKTWPQQLQGNWAVALWQTEYKLTSLKTVNSEPEFYIFHITGKPQSDTKHPTEQKCIL